MQSLRQQLVSAIAELPQEALTELISFVDYQLYKASRITETPSNQPSSPSTDSEAPLYERLSPQELAQAFLAWVESHDPKTPGLSDYAVSRESMYEDEVY